MRMADEEYVWEKENVLEKDMDNELVVGMYRE